MLILNRVRVSSTHDGTTAALNAPFVGVTVRKF